MNCNAVNWENLVPCILMKWLSFVFVLRSDELQLNELIKTNWKETKLETICVNMAKPYACVERKKMRWKKRVNARHIIMMAIIKIINSNNEQSNFFLSTCASVAYVSFAQNPMSIRNHVFGFYRMFYIPIRSETKTYFSSSYFVIYSLFHFYLLFAE